MMDIHQQTSGFRRDFHAMKSELAKLIVGQHEVVEGTLTALMAGGHVLLEGVPGLGKTLLVRTLSQITDLRFSRIQFTPDLMPADITGTNLVSEDEAGRRAFQFQAGPVFANVILADEINRATPKTQSALLEAMQEHSVTVGGVVRRLEEPVCVLATQNPIEMEGTYPLPEAQLDRFLLKLIVRSPSAAELGAILDRTTTEEMPTVEQVVDGRRVQEMQQLVRQVPVAEHVRDYAVRLVCATHPNGDDATDIVKQYVAFGASPRGAQALILCAKVRALMDERYNVAFEDIRAFAKPALRHRLILSFEGQAEGVATDEIVGELLEGLSTTETRSARRTAEKD
jgi:MoxR-like ATPase